MYHLDEDKLEYAIERQHTITDNILTLKFIKNQHGHAQITIGGYSNGKIVTDTFNVFVIERLMGDINNDGIIGLFDAVYLFQLLSMSDQKVYQLKEVIYNLQTLTQ